MIIITHPAAGSIRFGLAVAGTIRVGVHARSLFIFELMVEKRLVNSP
ncbi:MAG: hypothetical protein ACTSUE_21395 [Promethearchaeota archaeon]